MNMNEAEVTGGRKYTDKYSEKNRLTFKLVDYEHKQHVSSDFIYVFNVHTSYTMNGLNSTS